MMQTLISEQTQRTTIKTTTMTVTIKLRPTTISVSLVFNSLVKNIVYYSISMAVDLRQYTTFLVLQVTPILGSKKPIYQVLKKT